MTSNSRAIPATVSVSSPRIQRFVALAAVIVAALVVQVWAALQGTANFDSDEAVFGLMARHILQGQRPTYMYGQQYLGTLETFLSAGFMWLFGQELIVFRLSVLLLFAIFLVLHGWLTYQMWGFKVALISLLLLALPGRLILLWTFRPISGFGAISVLGTGGLIIAHLTLHQPWTQYLRLLLLGILFGLGFWSHPLMVVYIATLSIVFLLHTPEWVTLYNTVSKFCDRVVRIGARELLPVATLGVVGLAVTGFFSAGCEPRTAFAVAQTVARIALLVVIATVIGFLVRLSKRRVALLAGVGTLATGFALGDLPQWRAWLFFNVASDAALRPSCPTGTVPRTGLLGGELLPAIWGIPALPSLAQMQPVQSLLWLLVIIIVLAALLTFVWRGRTALWSLLALAPVSSLDRRFLTWGLLFGIPILLAVLSTNTIDVLSVRYLLIAWQASSVLLAFFLAQLTRRRILLALIAALWIIQVGLGNLVTVDRIWASRGDPFAPASVAVLEQWLTARDVQGGYTDYWSTYTIDFLMQERLTFAPYNGVERYPPYTQHAGTLQTQAFVFQAGLIPAANSQITDLVQGMQQSGPGLDVFPHVLDQLDDKIVIERQNVLNWDIWLVARP